MQATLDFACLGHVCYGNQETLYKNPSLKSTPLSAVFSLLKRSQLTFETTALK
jgi:hypothetical protein